MKYKINENIEVTDVEDDGSVICFDIVSGTTHILDEAGSAVLKTVGHGMTIDEAAEAISKDFDITADEIKDDVINFANELVQKGIIVEDK